MQYGIRCVATNPLVEKPQTAKLVNSSQKSTDFVPRTRPPMAMRNGLTALGTVGGSTSAPYGPSPTLPGLSASISSTRGISRTNTAATAHGTLCQPKCCARLARNGRKMSWPLALLAVSNPTTRPRLATNQRFATAVARPTMPAPEPTPTSTPQVA